MVLLSFLSLCLPAAAAVTVYTQVPMGASTVSAVPTAMVTYAAHFDPLDLVPPPAPNQTDPSTFPVQITSGGIPGLSIPVTGNFMGFSIELSVADQISEL